MGDRRISYQLKGNVFSLCVTPARVWLRGDGTNRETTGEDAGLRKQLSKKKRSVNEES